MTYITSIPDLSDPFTPAPQPGGPDPDANEIPDPPPEDD
jgi:hypothetical protein